MTPEQVEAFEDARSKTARLGGEPSIPSPHLPQRLYGGTTLMLLVWGTRDKVVPRRCIAADQKATSGVKGATIAGVRHQLEIECEYEFSRVGNEGLG